MGVESDWNNLGKRLISCYAKSVLEAAENLGKKRFPQLKDQRDAQFASTITSLVHKNDIYKNEAFTEKALNAIDLGKIFARVEEREASSDSELWGYEDFLVQETLFLFKNEFFKWIDKPKCSKCDRNGDNIEFIGAVGPPLVNPDEIGRIEKYKCKDCDQPVEFPRINNPAKLLDTRCGRCGEWVNCFMLVLQSVLGLDAQLRYIWNREDHVWCEYYSRKQNRWIHLDPCENVFDEPSLYCENWGKEMSYIIGIGNNYVIDLSDKYITKEEKRIPKSDVVSSEAVIEKLIKSINARLMLAFWHNDIKPHHSEDKHEKLYEELILVHNKELLSLKTCHTVKEPSQARVPRGRQSGSAEWTSARGEDGA
ncbi:hypothetical protein FDK38_000253 [Candidozyma auris]|nr:hypothetical protein FDK38_000253 [[Candida] auris]